MSKLKVNELDTRSGTDITVTTGKTVVIPAGATISVAGTQTVTGSQTNTGTLDISGATVTLPATLPATAGTNITGLPAANVTGTLPANTLGNVDTSGIEANKNDIALLAFQTQANGSLARYSLVDQTVDSFEDATGVDAGSSTNATRNASNYYSGVLQNISGGTVSAFGATKTIRVFDTPGSMSMVVTGAGGNIDVMMVAGGGGGGKVANAGTAGGAGGVLWDQTKAVTAQTYNFTIGAGGAGYTETPPGSSQQGPGTNGGDTVGFGATAKGGGGGGGGVPGGQVGLAGGSGGGGGYGGGAGGAADQPAYPGFTAYAYAGGAGGPQAGAHGGGGGGGAGAAGTAGANPGGGPGGNGWNGSGVFGTGVGDSGVFGGGGGGGGSVDGPDAAGGTGGGGAGKQVSSGNVTGGAATDGTGGGGGGGGVHGNGGDGGNGAVVIGYTTTDFEGAADMTLVSTAVTAQAAPTKGDLVFTYTNGAGTAVLGTNITVDYSADNGSTWTDFGVAAADTQGTTGGHTIVAKHDVALTSTSGTAMRYRLKTLVQSAALNTRIHAVSLGWS